jgi:hypothetical protein
MMRWGILLGLMAIAGVVVTIVVGDTVGDAIGIALVGLAGVGAVSLVFLWVGRTEDRERGRTRRR